MKNHPMWLKFGRFWSLLLLPVIFWMPIREGRWHVVWLSVGLGIAVSMTAALFSYPARLKAAWLQATRSSESSATVLDQWPRLDRAAWDELALGWRELGFEPCGIVEQKTAVSAEVSQNWRHPEQRALAGISQGFVPQRALPVTTFVVSFWGDGDALQTQARELKTAPAPIASPLPAAARVGAEPVSERLPIYSYGTHNRLPNWTLNLLLHPQTMGTRLTGAAPAELWATHLTRRALVSQVLEQEPLEGDLEAVLNAHNRVMRAIWHRRLSSRFGRQLWRAKRCGTTQNETWGELEPQILALEN